MLIAGIAGLKRGSITPTNDSGWLLRSWIERQTFTWLVSHDIVEEYRQVLARLGVRRSLIGDTRQPLAGAPGMIAPREESHSC